MLYTHDCLNDILELIIGVFTSWGAVPMFEGLNCICGNISEEALQEDCTEGISIF